MSGRGIAGAALLAACFIIAVFIAVHVYQDRREKAFNAHLEQASDDISEVIDKIDSDQAVFDLADDRATASTQELRRLAYSDMLRKGALDLAMEIGHLRACRAARNLPNSQFDKCLSETEKLNSEAFRSLPALK